MLLRTKFLTVSAMVFGLSGPVFSQDVTADTVVSTVNGADITLGHMIVLRDGLSDQYRNLPDDVLFDGILEQLQQQIVLSGQIGEPSKRIMLQLENDRRSMLAADAVQILANEGVTDEMLQAAYESKYASAEPVKEFNASHILVETEDEAKALVVELEGGADFAELAKEKSTGPSGPSGGELGWFGPGMMVVEFETAAAQMEVGDISPPVQTQFGWHVLIMNDIRVQSAPALDEVRAEITNELQQKIVADALAALMEGADIKTPEGDPIDPAVLQNLELVSE